MQDNPVSQIPHPEHVQFLAVALFDYTRPFHGLDDNSRHVLETAALLIDHPFAVQNTAPAQPVVDAKASITAHSSTPQSMKKALKHARALVETLWVQGLTIEEEKILAAVIAFHWSYTQPRDGKKKRIKKKDWQLFNLSPAQQSETLTIAALLRIAEGLDASHTSSTSIQLIEPTRAGMWIVVEGAYAVSDAQAAQAGACLWAETGSPPFMVMDAAEAALKIQPYPSPDVKMALSPSEPMVEAARKVMRYNFAQMLKHEPGTRLGENIEALHDMRVATRRMRASFEVFKDFFEPGALKPHLKGLRSTGRALGAVRDLDVFIEKANKYLQTLPEGQHEDLAPLTQSWEAQREQARVQMLVFLDSYEYAIFKHEFNIFLHTAGAGALSLPAEQPVAYRVSELAPVLIYTRLAAALAFDGSLADAPIERLHALRIEFKKLRYTVEYFRDVLGSQAQEIIDELKLMQDHLGDLNDAHLAIQLLQPFIENVDEQHVEFVRHYIEYRSAEKQRLLATFPQAWEHFKRHRFRQNLAKAIAAL